MKRSIAVLLGAAMLVGAGTVLADSVTFDFEPLGQEYGDPVGQLPGAFMFSEGGADLYVENIYISGNPYFDGARIVGALGSPYFFGSNQVLAVSNVDIRFVFSGPGDVVFDYLDQGGTVNIEVNGAGLFEGPDLASLAGVVAPGVTMSVTSAMVAGAQRGVVTLSGPVQTLVVGGQEFFLEGFACYNSADAAGCPVGITHQTLGLGSVWGAGYGTVPGDLIFVEDGIPVRAELFDWGGGTLFNSSTVVSTPVAAFGFDRVMNLNNISNRYSIAALSLVVHEVTFEFYDAGGTENLQVNGATLHIGDLHLMPPNVAPGVTMNVVTYPVGAGIRGEVKLSGPVNDLLLGGQEFWVDNICVDGTSLTGDCDLVSDNTSLLPGTTWGAAFGEVPGDHVFTEDGIDARVWEFDYGSGLLFNEVLVGAPWGPIGDGNVLHLNNIVVGYDLAPFAPVDWVSFEFCRGGGVENLEMAGVRYVGDITMIPAGFFPGFTVIVASTAGPGYDYGKITIVGPVQDLRIGGQEFYIDYLCVSRDDLSGVPGVATGAEVDLGPGVPNPFNPTTRVAFSVARAGHVSLRIYDLSGRLVRTLVDEQRDAGDHHAVWNGRDDGGRNAGAGMYFLRLESGGQVATGKITMLK